MWSRFGVAFGVFPLVLCCLVPCFLGSCYRLTGPPPLREAIAVVTVANNARLPRIQAYAQDAVARELGSTLGWTVSPAGPARLELSFDEERIRSTATDARDIPDRWYIRVQGTAVLRCAHGVFRHAFSGTGFTSALADEPAALRAAADAIATDLSAWLEREAAAFKTRSP